MAKAEYREPKEREVVLTMTESEARALRWIMGCTAGGTITDPVFDALRTLLDG